MSLILRIKTDRVDAATGTPLVRIVIERIAAGLADDARAVFGGHPMLVPVPGSPGRGRLNEIAIGIGAADGSWALYGEEIKKLGETLERKRNK